MISDHYATLGVPPTADPAAIRAAYLALLRQFHPDKNASPAAVERAQAIIAAFKVLGDFDRRNHYDWDRRRAREAAELLAAKGPRTIGAGTIAAGVIGLAAVGGLWLMAGSRPAAEPAATTQDAPQPTIAEVRQSPPQRVEPVARPTRRAAAGPAAATKRIGPAPAVARAAPPAPIPPRVEPVRVAKIAPVRAAKTGPERMAKIEPPRIEPAKARATPVAARSVAANTVARPAPKAAPVPPLVRQAEAVARPVRQAARQGARNTTDLATLDQFVMSYYGQSWRFGDRPKRAILEQTRASFVARRGACAAEACKRAAYLQLMREVSEIVETGGLKTR